MGCRRAPAAEGSHWRHIPHLLPACKSCLNIEHHWMPSSHVNLELKPLCDLTSRIRHSLSQTHSKAGLQIRNAIYPSGPSFDLQKCKWSRSYCFFPTSLASGTFFKFGEFPVLHFKNHALEALAVSWLAKLPLSDWRRDLQEKERGY